MDCNNTNLSKLSQQASSSAGVFTTSRRSSDSPLVLVNAGFRQSEFSQSNGQFKDTSDSNTRSQNVVPIKSSGTILPNNLRCGTNKNIDSIITGGNFHDSGENKDRKDQRRKHPFLKSKRNCDSLPSSYSSSCIPGDSGNFLKAYRKFSGVELRGSVRTPNLSARTNDQSDEVICHRDINNPSKVFADIAQNTTVADSDQQKFNSEKGVLSCSASEIQNRQEDLSKSAETSHSTKDTSFFNNCNDPSICFAESPDMPGIPIVFRKKKTLDENSERLNLDRRNLTVIPLLQKERLLRLLNFQNNQITHINNLIGLPNLIFLDLYNNNLEKIENLDALQTLRVLMLGRNRITGIENLDKLPKLDVLDLHSNQIDKISNISMLSELRVLNLAGNKIEILENISGLSSLAELNLRRNLICRVDANYHLPSLQRVFLSNNKLVSFIDIRPLMKSHLLSEICIDKNPISINGDTQMYRLELINSFPNLHQIDSKAISEIEKKNAYLLLRKEDEKKREQQRADFQEAERAQAIKMAKSKWEEKANNALSCQNFNSDDDVWGRSSRNYKSISSSLSFEDSRVGFSEVEVYGVSRRLYIYGDALEALDSTKIHNFVTGMVIKYISIESISTAISSPTNRGLKLMTNLTSIAFEHNNIRYLEQLCWLATLNESIIELTIENNSICSSQLLRSFVALQIPNISKLNGIQISDSDRSFGMQFFKKTSMISQPLISQPPKLQNRSTSLNKLPPGSKRSSVGPLNGMIDDAIEIATKSKIMESLLPTLIENLVKDNLEDNQDIDSYISSCLKGL